MATTARPHADDVIETPAQWMRLLGGFVPVFALFHWSAQALGSDFGEAGIIVAVFVVGATLVVERVLFGQGFVAANRSLGLGAPHVQGLTVVATCALALLLVVPIFAAASGASFAFRLGWIGLIPGLFAQAGIAEETLFRGYLFGRLRRRRSFWRATGLSMLPFVAVHLLLFFTMPWPIALAALMLSAVLSIPLAWLYELGGSTIWAPAILHFVVQSVVKVIVFPDPSAASFPLAWMAASALLPMLVVLVPRSRDNERA